MKEQNYTTPNIFKVLSKNFDVSEATGSDEIAIILGLFTAIKTATKRPAWKLTNRDYTLCSRFAVWAKIFEFSDIKVFQSFLTDELIPEIGNKDPLGSYVSLEIRERFKSYRKEQRFKNGISGRFTKL